MSKTYRKPKRSDERPAPVVPAIEPSWSMPRERWPLLALFLIITIGSFVAWSAFSRQPYIDEYAFDVVNSYPHDATSFTQGLVYHEGFLYESTGQLGESKIRKVDLKSGVPAISKDLDPKFFGEGLALVDDRLVQLTWQNRVGIVYDLELNELSRFDVDDDAWGLAFDGKQLIMSDGTSTLRFLNPTTFEVEREVMVRHGNGRIGDLNELEFINGLIYANVWKSDWIFMIRPMDGKVVGRIDLRKLYPYSERKSSEDVLNGIAINTETGNLLVTGKDWPKVYEIDVYEINSAGKR